MRILVAEDEEDIKNVYYMTLAERQHEVILTSDGEECLKVYRQEFLRTAASLSRQESEFSILF